MKEQLPTLEGGKSLDSPVSLRCGKCNEWFGFSSGFAEFILIQCKNCNPKKCHQFDLDTYEPLIEKQEETES